MHIKIAGAFALLFLSTAATADFYVRCDGCSSSRSQAMAIVSYRGEGLHHVMDSMNNRVKSYRLTVVTGGGNNPFEIGEEITATLVSTPTQVTNNFHKVMDTLAQAAQGSDVPADTISRSDNTGYINSAADVIANTANLSRVSLFITNDIIAITNGIAVEMLNEYLQDVVLEIRFSDGSTLNMTIRSVVVLADSTIRFELSRVEDSARTADDEMLPDSSDDFDGLQLTLGEGNGLSNAFEGLANLFNVPIYNSTGSRIGGGGGGEYHCVATSTGVLCRRGVF